MKPLVMHKHFVSGVRFSPDGHWLVSVAGLDARIWDTKTADLLTAIVVDSAAGGNDYRWPAGPEPRLIVATGEPGVTFVYRIVKS